MDADRKMITWKELYKKIYTPEEWDFWSLFDFNYIYKSGKVGFRKGIVWDSVSEAYKRLYDETDGYFCMSGDADFGLKGTRLKGEMHKFTNFSLMPVPGGMNNKKGRFKYKDDFPLFLYHLAAFWDVPDEESRKEHTIEHLWWNSRKNEKTADWLFAYLSLFDNIYDYTNKIYHIDFETTEELCKFGKNGNGKNEQYLNMAEKYLSIRKQLFVKNGIDAKLIDEDISDDKYD